MLYDFNRVPSKSDILAGKIARGEITTKEQPICKWIIENFGVLSRIAREENVTPVTVHLCALNKRKSKDLRVERALKALGCPLLQRIG